LIYLNNKKKKNNFYLNKYFKLNKIKNN